ncbi:MAG TPA: IPT/TIG domain-containing protein [Bryobacteraceae bacterium]|nr:IPT/TIG domain-containing protein [Bryobacteraceae bacterium]
MKRLPGLFFACFLATGALFAQAPAINDGGVVDAASFAAGRPVSAGNIVAIFGSNLATKLTVTDTVTLSTTLGNVSVTFNGVNAALQFVSPGQINAQVPWDVLPSGQNGTVNAVVTSAGASSAPAAVTINQFGPGVYAAGGHAFAINAQDPNSVRYASFAAPVDTFGTGCDQTPLPATCAYKAFPAQTGDVLLVYAGGLGALDNAVQTGQLPPAGVIARTTTTPMVLVNNVPAQVLYSGMSSFVGVYQINIVVPTGVSGGTLPFQVQIGGITTTASTTIAVE